MSLLLGLLLAVQVPDTTIRFLDYSPTDAYLIDNGRKLYVFGRTAPGDSWKLLIVSCPSLERTGVVPLGDFVTWPSAAYSARHNKVYQNSGYGIEVIDNDRDTWVGRVPMPAPHNMAYNTLNDRLYAPALGVGFIIDCRSDSVVKVLSPTDSVAGICVWDSAGDKVYMGGWGWRTGDRVNVVDCAHDSVVLSYPTGVLWATSAVSHPTRRRVYLRGASGCAVIDCASDSLIRHFRSFSGPSAPVVVPQEDKVYWLDQTGFGSSDTLQVTDCRAETVLHCVQPPRPPWNSWFLHGSAYAEWSNRLYVTAGGRVGSTEGYWLVSVDCSGDSLLGWVPLPSEPVSVVANPYDRRIYVVSYADSAIYVYRDEVPAVAERTPPTAHGSRLAASHVRGVLNLPRDMTESPGSSGRVPKLPFIDATGRRVLSLKPGPNDVSSLAPGVYFVLTPTAAGRVVTRTTILK